MLTDRRYTHRMQDESRVDIPLILSILIHVVLGLGLYYISKPHPPKEATSVQTTLITADMLRQMKANQAKAQNNNEPTENLYVPNVTDTANQPHTQKTPSSPDLLVPSVLASNPNETNQPRIFEPVATSEKQRTKPVSTKKLQPEVGKPDVEGHKKTQEWADRQQKIIDDMKRQKQAEDARKKEYNQREKDALAQQRATEKRKLQEKRDAEKQRLADMKQAEKDKDKRIEADRKRIAAEQKAQRERQEKERKRLEAQRRKDAIANGTKSLGVENEFENEAKALSSGPTAAQIGQAKATYIGRIKRRVTANWKGTVDRRIVVPVKIRLSPDGSVESVRVTRSSGDLALDRSIEQAIDNSSPLPVPKNIAVFNKTFKSFTFEFVAE